jgi:hypothetical protein
VHHLADSCAADKWTSGGHTFTSERQTLHSPSFLCDWLVASPRTSKLNSTHGWVLHLCLEFWCSWIASASRVSRFSEHTWMHTREYSSAVSGQRPGLVE